MEYAKKYKCLEQEYTTRTRIETLDFVSFMKRSLIFAFFPFVELYWRLCAMEIEECTMRTKIPLVNYMIQNESEHRMKHRHDLLVSTQTDTHTHTIASHLNTVSAIGATIRDQTIYLTVRFHNWESCPHSVQHNIGNVNVDGDDDDDDVDDDDDDDGGGGCVKGLQ